MRERFITHKPYSDPNERSNIIRTLILLWLIIPVFSQLFTLVGLFILETAGENYYHSGLIAFSLFYSIIMLVFGFYIAKQNVLPINFARRYWLLFSPIIYILLLWVIAMQLSGGSFVNPYFNNLLIFGMLPFCFAYMGAMFLGDFWFYLFFVIGTYTLFSLGCIIATWSSRKALLFYSENLKHVLTLSCVGGILLGLISYQAHEKRWHILTNYTDSELTINEIIHINDYKLVVEDNSLTPLLGDRTLSIASDYPRLDGASALYPLYASAASGIYQDDMANFVTSTTTPNAYQRLIDGKTDLIFSVEPTDKLKKSASTANVELHSIPLVREAFVFLVNKQNPITNLSLEQVRDIYSGKVTNWQQIGGSDSRIMAFQRPADTGSQRMMELHVMKGLKMISPIIVEIPSSTMGGIEQRIAQYRNYPDSLGYTYQYYAMKMARESGQEFRLLSIDGIEPTEENIQSAAYPLTITVAMVYARAPSKNTQKLIRWFLSPQGQRLIDDAGYISISNPNKKAN